MAVSHIQTTQANDNWNQPVVSGRLTPVRVPASAQSPALLGQYGNLEGVAVDDL